MFFRSQKQIFQGPKRLRFEGLEIRLVLSAVLPFSQLTVTQSLSEGGFVGDKAFNGEGMTGNLHNNDHTKNWLAGNPGGSFSVTDQWLKIDLGGTYELDFLRVWNNNHPGLTNLGISQADIYVAAADPNGNINESNTAFDPTGWTLAIANQAFSESPGGVLIAQTDPDISLGNIPAAFLAIKIDANHGNSLAVGLSEMRIFGTEIITGLPRPTDLQARGISGSEISLTWTDNASNETGYDVYQSSDGTNFFQIPGAGLAANTESYTATGLNANTRYDFRVVATNAGGDSQASIEASAKTYTLGEEVDASVKLYVSPTGSDSNTGTVASPFATLEKARTAVQQIKNSTGLPENGIAVILRGGIHRVTNTFSLGASDSGSPGKPITYTSFPGEQARILGGDTLDSQWFSPVNSSDTLWSSLDTGARPNIVVADLNAHGITNYGALLRRHADTTNGGALHLYFNDKPLTLARWPDKPPVDSPENYSDLAANDGWTNIVGTNGSSTISFTQGDRHERWGNASDPLVHGNFVNNFADNHFRVGSINTGTNTITLDPGQGAALVAGQPYYAYNLVEEITQPGEWYLDRATGKLYLWAPSDINTADMFVSIVSNNIVELNNASHIVLKNLVIEGGRNDLVKITNGSTNNVIEGSTLRNTGGNAVEVRNEDLTNVYSGAMSKNNVIRNNEIAYTGEDGIILGGGNRSTLERGDNVATNNDIHDFGYWVGAFNPGVQITGIGQTVSNNDIYQGPHAAIVFIGNDHVMELNDIHDVVRMHQDMGPIYGGRDWGFRGNEVRHNFIHDVHTFVDRGNNPVFGVYLDDATSGMTVFGNIIANIDGYGILAGGGRDNFIMNNVIFDTSMPFFIDNRGISQINHNGTFTGNTTGAGFNSWDLLNRIEFGVPISTGINDPTTHIDRHAEPWKSAYPELDEIPDDFPVRDRDGIAAAAANHWLWPEGNEFSKNISFIHGVGNAAPQVIQSNQWPSQNAPNPYDLLTAANNVVQNPLFVDAASGNYNLQPASPAFSIPGFQTIPFDQIGRIQTTSDADFDSDGDIDGSDFLNWQRGFGTDVGSGQIALRSEGNANGDQFVNGDDLTVWQSQYGTGSGSSAAVISAPAASGISTSEISTEAAVSKPISTLPVTNLLSSFSHLSFLSSALAKDEALESFEVEHFEGHDLSGWMAEVRQSSIRQGLPQDDSVWESSENQKIQEETADDWVTDALFSDEVGAAW